MSEATDDTKDIEELWEELRYLHNTGECDLDCPYCNDEFKPIFLYQKNNNAN